MPLTDLACRNARCPEGVPYVRLADGGGLNLEVTAAGGKLWRWKYRFGGKEKRLIQLMALTLVRTSELIQARWDEFDLERAEWTIPPDGFGANGLQGPDDRAPVPRDRLHGARRDGVPG
jgi:hypothetical protein